MLSPDTPIAVSPNQVAELNAKLATMRHNVNNHLAFVVAASELIRRKPDLASRLVENILQQPERITTEIKNFSALVEGSSLVRNRDQRRIDNCDVDAAKIAAELPFVEPAGETRIDKWLWAVRLYKTRSLATKACRGGHVSIGGQPVKPSRSVRLDEVVRARTGDILRTVKVIGLIENRVGPKLVNNFLED